MKEIQILENKEDNVVCLARDVVAKLDGEDIVKMFGMTMLTVISITAIICCSGSTLSIDDNGIKIGNAA